MGRSVIQASKLLTLGLAGGVVVAALLLASDAVRPRMTLARDRGQAIEAGASSGAPAPDAQTAPSGNGDHRMAVMLWTVLAAGCAMGLGLILFVVRIAVGRPKPPPPAADPPH